MKCKIISALTCLALTLALLGGCASTEVRDYSGSQTAAPTAAAETAAPAETGARDYAEAYAAHAGDELVVTINGLPVTWDECFYWLSYGASLLEYYVGPVENWDAVCELDETVTNRQFISDYALESLIQYRALETGAGDIGAELSEEDRAELDALWEQDVADYAGGDEAAFEELLSEQYLTRELYQYLNNVTALYYNCMEELFGENGEKCQTEDVLEYAESVGYMVAKHILLSTVDDAGAALPAEQQAEKRARAEELLSQLRAVDPADTRTLEETFDRLMNEYSEDPGSAYYPAGYCFTSGEMVAEFEDAVRALGDYGLSDLVESSYGYHIILRLPVTPDVVVEYYSEDEQYTLAYLAANDFYSAMVSDWFDQAQVDFAPAFADGNLAASF